MNKSKWGYKKTSPYISEDFIDIQDNNITMEGVEFPVMAYPDNDKPVLMMPGKNYRFPNSSKVREIPMKQHGGTNIMSGLAGESTVPVSPFIDLKPFIKKYKLKYGGVIDYMTTLPLEVQAQFAQDFDSLSKGEKDEVVVMLKGGYYQTGGVSEYQTGGQPFEIDVDNIQEGTFYIPDDKPELLDIILKHGYAYDKL